MMIGLVFQNEQLIHYRIYFEEIHTVVIRGSYLAEIAILAQFNECSQKLLIVQE